MFGEPEGARVEGDDLLTWNKAVRTSFKSAVSCGGLPATSSHRLDGLELWWSWWVKHCPALG